MLNCCFRQWYFPNFRSSWQCPPPLHLHKGTPWVTCMEVWPSVSNRARPYRPCCCAWIEANPCCRFEHLAERLKSQERRLDSCPWLRVEMLTQYIRCVLLAIGDAITQLKAACCLLVKSISCNLIIECFIECQLSSNQGDGNTPVDAASCFLTRTRYWLWLTTSCLTRFILRGYGRVTVWLRFVHAIVTIGFWTKLLPYCRWRCVYWWLHLIRYGMYWFSYKGNQCSSVICLKGILLNLLAT